MKNISKMIFGVIYFIGTCITLALSVIFLLRSSVIINEDAMIPYKLYEQSFMLLAFGAIPMVISCYIVYKIYDIKNSYNHKRNKVIIFMPGIICMSCAFFVIGTLFIGMINSFILN